jgi:hypothetical protein
MMPTAADRALGAAALAGSHFVQFYERDTHLIDSVTRFVGEGLQHGWACIVVATPEHRESLEARLLAEGHDLRAALARGRYLPFDAAGMLASSCRQRGARSGALQ